MDELTKMLNDINIDKPDDIILQIIEYDFNQLTRLFLNGETNIYIEPEAFHEYYLTPENCRIIYNYLGNNYIGYNLLKKKVSKEIISKRFNIPINDTDIQTYVDYYLQTLIIE